MSDQKLVYLSAGGTGGHMTPAQALGKDLLSRGYKVALITDDRGAKYSDMFGDIPVHIIKSGTAGPGITGKVTGGINLSMGITKAVVMLMNKRPDLVVGFGGYPSVPAVYAAQLLKIPTIIHEQNAIIGKANAFLAPRAERIAISLPTIQGLQEPEKIHTIFTGNPVRPDIAALYTEPYPVVQQDGTLQVLVIGGSLGATVLSEIVPAALKELPEEYRNRLEIVQQCREGDLETVKAAYEEAGISARLAVFFDNMADELRAAHLVICRSGASTVSELTIAGRPAIFVPYPHHKDQQQKMNADAVADVGGGWVMTESGFTVQALKERIEMFFQNPEMLFRAAEQAQSCGRPDATRKLGNLVTALISGWGDK